MTDNPLGVLRGGASAVGLPQGKALIQFTRAVVHLNGVFVVVHAATNAEAVAAVAALRPIVGGALVAPAIARAGADRLAPS